MTLKEFVKAFMEANNIDKDVDEMCKHIAKEAQKLQKDGCACLDEEQVEKIILGAKLEAPKEKNQPVFKPEPEETKAVSSQKPNKNEMKSNVPDQLDIFSLGVEL